MACGVRQVVSSDICLVRVSGVSVIGETAYPASRDSIGPSPDSQRIRPFHATYPSNSCVPFLSTNRYDVDVASQESLNWVGGYLGMNTSPPYATISPLPQSYRRCCLPS